MLEQTIANLEQRVVLLAPSHAQVPTSFRGIVRSSDEHADLLRAAQRMRGLAYVEDGAIEPQQLSADGLHQTPEDDESWHLLFTNGDRQVTACVWYKPVGAGGSVDDLRVRSSPLLGSPMWRDKVYHAVESELARARYEHLGYAEIGGWAVARENRCSGQGLLLALGVYSLSRALGGALGLTTATVRNSSAGILRRLGGSYLQTNGEAVPPYYDPHYGCVMELLRFDSRAPNARYAKLVEALRERFAHVPVLWAGAQAPDCHAAALPAWVTNAA